MMDQPRVLSSEELYKGRVFRLRVDTIEVDGSARKLDIVEHPGSFAIVPVKEDGRLILIRQYRHAAKQALWEIPAGTAEPDEECAAGALRELREETGCTAERLELIAAVYPTPGYSTELVHIYAAYGLHAGEQELEEDEDIEIREVTLDEALAMQASGEIRDMKTLLALFWLSAKKL